MPLRAFALTLILLLVLIEGGLGVWRNAGLTPSTAPVFSWPPAVARFGKLGEIQGSIDTYHADRGAECRLDAPDGSQITALYFEWDRIEAGPMMEFANHAPEECNEYIGYKLLGIDPNRTHEVPGQLPLQFDCTRFLDSSGRELFIFKTAWIQGLGSSQLRVGLNRSLRLKRSFVRHIGAARVLQAGVFGARDADHAWQVFQSEVLAKLEWK